DRIGLVRHANMKAGPVGLRVDRDRADAHLPESPHHAYGDLPAVGDEDFSKACHSPYLSSPRRRPAGPPRPPPPARSESGGAPPHAGPPLRVGLSGRLG